MSYVTKNPLINPMTLTKIGYDKLIGITTQIVNQQLKTDLTETEVKEVVDFVFQDLIDWILNPVVSSAYEVKGFMTLHVNYFSVTMRIRKLVALAKQLRDKPNKNYLDEIRLKMLKRKISTLWKKRDLSIIYPYPRHYNIRKNTRKYVTQFDNDFWERKDKSNLN